MTARITLDRYIYEDIYPAFKSRHRRKGNHSQRSIAPS